MANDRRHRFEERPDACPRCSAPFQDIEPGQDGDSHTVEHVPDRHYFRCGHSMYQDRGGEWVEVAHQFAPSCVPKTGRESTTPHADPEYAHRRHERKMQNPEYRAAYEEAQAGMVRESTYPESGHGANT